MAYLYVVPLIAIAAVVFERVTDPARVRRRALRREYRDNVTDIATRRK